MSNESINLLRDIVEKKTAGAFKLCDAAVVSEGDLLPLECITCGNKVEITENWLDNKLACSVCQVEARNEEIQITHGGRILPNKQYELPLSAKRDFECDKGHIVSLTFDAMQKRAITCMDCVIDEQTERLYSFMERMKLELVEDKEVRVDRKSTRYKMRCTECGKEFNRTLQELERIKRNSYCC